MAGKTRKFILRGDGQAALTTEDVSNWQDIKPTIERDSFYRGLFRKFTNQSFVFVENGRKIIRDTKTKYGIDAEQTMEIQVGNQSGHDSSFKSIGVFAADYGSYDIGENDVNLKFIDDSFEEKIRSREDIPINLNRLTSFDGEEIQPFQNETNRVELRDRKLFLETQYGLTGGLFFIGFFGNDSFPFMEMFKNSDEDSKQVVATSTGTPDNNPAADALFYLRAEKDKVLRNVDFRVGGVVSDNIGSRTYSLIIKKYDSDLILKENIVLGSGDGAIEDNVVITYNDDIQVLQGESLGLYWESDQILAINGNLFPDFFFNYDTVDNFPATSSDTIFIHEAITRVLQIMTGLENPFFSRFFGRPDSELNNQRGPDNIYTEIGDGALFGIQNGKMIRGFDYSLNPVNLTFRDILDVIKIFNLGCGVKVIDGQPTFVIEPIEEFYNPGKIIKLTNVKNVRLKAEPKLAISSIEVGYKDQSYEEVNGLDSFNGKFVFGAPIRSSGEKLDIVAKKLRADDYGIEFARRKQASFTSTEDTRYDNDNFIIAYRQLLDGTFVSKGGQEVDGYDSVTGILQPESAFNLDISPGRILRNWSNIYTAAYLKKRGLSLTYSKGANNFDLVSQKTGDVSIVESDDIPITIDGLDNPSNLKTPLFVDDLYELDAIVDQDQWEAIQNDPDSLFEFTTFDNGVEVRNFGYAEKIEYSLSEDEIKLILKRTNR